MTTLELVDQLRADVSAIVTTVHVELAALSPEVLNTPEGPGRWSILQCLEHLNCYSRYYNPALLKTLPAKRQPMLATGAKSTWLGRFCIGMMEPTNTKPQKTFKRMDPAAQHLDYSVITEFLEHQETLLDILDRLDHDTLNRKTVPFEFLKLIRLNVAETLQIVITHERRHMLQALRVKATTLAHVQPALRV